MRLLNTKTGQFKEFLDLDQVQYAILSHTWRSEDDGGEQTYEQLRKIQVFHGPDGCRLDTLPADSVPPPAINICLSPCCVRYRTPPDCTTGAVPIPPRSVSPFDAVQSLAFAKVQVPAEDRLPASSAASDPGVTDQDPSSEPRTGFSIWDHPELSPKVREACKVARENGYEWIWIDSSCIDKSSSSELSEAINSMYLWYARAKVCYAFLADVDAEEDHWTKGWRFRQSKWFRRGWTLQELIAPFNVEFFSKDWTPIGSKHSLADLVEDVTGISCKALLHLEKLDEFSIAQRLSWASKRETTRVEDRAYSLLGIFGINMPTLYGEGEHAFRRLQEEIMRRIPDQSLYAWGSVYLASEMLRETESVSAYRRFFCWPWSQCKNGSSLIVDSLDGFKDGGRIEAVSHDDVFARLRLSNPPLGTEYTSTPHGIRTQVPVIPLSLSHYLPVHAIECFGDVPLSQWYLVILGCKHTAFPGHLLGRLCFISPSASGSGVEFLRSGHVDLQAEGGWTLNRRPELSCELFPLSPATLERCRPQIELKTVYISHPNRADVTPKDVHHQPHKTVTLIMARETRDALRDQGYAGHLRGPDQIQDRPRTHRLTLSNHEHTITIEYQHTIDGHWLTIDASVQMSGSLHDSARDIHGVNPSNSKAVSWTDDGGRYGWKASLGNKVVKLPSEGARTCTVTLGLDHGGLGSYFLLVNVRNTASCPRPPSPAREGKRRRISWNGNENEVIDVERSGGDGPTPMVVDAQDTEAGRPEEHNEAGEEYQAWNASAEEEEAGKGETKEDPNEGDSLEDDGMPM